MPKTPNLSKLKERDPSKKQVTLSKFFCVKPKKDDAADVNKPVASPSTCNSIPAVEARKVHSEGVGKKRLIHDVSTEKQNLPKRQKCDMSTKSDVDCETPVSSHTKNHEDVTPPRPVSAKTKSKLQNFSATKDWDTHSKQPKQRESNALTGFAEDTHPAQDDGYIKSDGEGTNALSFENSLNLVSSDGEGSQQSDKLTLQNTFKSGVKGGHGDRSKDGATVNQRSKSQYTPLELQFMEIKSKHPHTVLFVECGYKYRFFGDDAEIAAKELNIYCHMDHNFMTASIPTHRLFVHVRRLVAAGYKVGVVKQTETAALKAAGENKSAPFTRELSALYTKSTLIGEDVDPLCSVSTSGDMSPNCYLLCVCEAQMKEEGRGNITLGCVAVQPSTGDIIYDSFTDNSSRTELETRLGVIQPVEILLPLACSQETKKLISHYTSSCVNDSDRCRVEHQKNDKFEYSRALQCVAEFYTSNGNKDQGERGSLFWVLNNTLTKFGDRLLRKWVAQPLLDVSALNDRLDAVTELMTSECVALSRMREELRKLPDLEKGLCTIYHKKCSTLEFLRVTQSLSRIQSLLHEHRGLMSSQQSACMLREIFEQTPVLLEGIHGLSNAINEKAAKEGDKCNLITDESQFPDVVRIKAEIAQVTTSIHNHRRDVRLTLKAPALDYVTVSGQEFLIEVKNSNLKLVPSDWKKISITKAVSRFHSPFIVKAYQKLNELREQLIHECNKAWLEFLEQFGEHYLAYRTAVGNLATLDCLFSLATVAKLAGYVRPTFVKDQAVIQIEEGRHPVVDLLLDGQDQYVPNGTKLDGSGERCMIITGPNMGGKSSYIRQVALISIMAQIGSYVPAKAATVGILDAVYTRMGASDAIYQHCSTFMLELQEASEIMSHATEQSLVILDELGRGTSTHDGVAIAYATLRYFVEEVKCLTLFVTHYPILSTLETLLPGCVANYHMSFMLGNDTTSSEKKEEKDNTSDTVTFLYHLVPGMAAKSYGLNVARLADVPENVIQVATRKSHELERILEEKRIQKELFLKLIHGKEKNFPEIFKELGSKD
ncbi:DNA mismatch repair protein Msh3-like [Lingula anatina]|uniref:DNA mismatch repair protein MSH3 n=1 Tax=Lingula anatina TaxID=7574 RepID=A0A1S3HVT3_LINAN|nr:DNA mismatch repair protein Msh3-like [Lingula anatina]|eukprot:XP_013390152.1 DNA mismatch repair protein Msh3-like [Lingula anatina]